MAELTPHPHRDQDLGEGTLALVRTLRLAFGFLRALILILLTIFVFSGLFILDQNEKAFVLRFGSIVDEHESPIRVKGKWHWAWPKPIDQVIRYRVGESKSLASKSFWYNEPERNILSPQEEQPPAEEGPEGAKLITGKDGYLLTADTNILHAKWSITYQISDPIAYYKNYEKPEDVLLATLDTAVLHEVSKTPIGAAFPGGDALRIAVKDELVRLLELRDIGITLGQLNYDAQTPPKTTLNAFLGVTEAREERSRLISKAEEYRSDTVRRAEGERTAIIADAQAYKSNVEASVLADASYIRQIKDEYRKSGPAMLTPRYVDTLLEVTDLAKAKYIVYPNQEVRVLLGPKKKNPNTQQNAPTH